MSELKRGKNEKKIKEKKEIAPNLRQRCPKFQQNTNFYSQVINPKKMGLLMDMLSDRTIAVSVCSIIIQIYTLLTVSSELPREQFYRYPVKIRSLPYFPSSP